MVARKTMTVTDLLSSLVLVRSCGECVQIPEGEWCLVLKLLDKSGWLEQLLNASDHEFAELDLKCWLLDHCIAFICCNFACARLNDHAVEMFLRMGPSLVPQIVDGRGIEDMVWVCGLLVISKKA